MYPSGHPNEDEQLQVADLWTGERGAQILAFDELTYLRGMAQILAGGHREWSASPERLPGRAWFPRVVIYAPDPGPLHSRSHQGGPRPRPGHARTDGLSQCEGRVPGDARGAARGRPVEAAGGPLQRARLPLCGRGRGLQLYSVGPDRMDNGGAPFDQQRREEGVPTGDIVWIQAGR